MADLNELQQRATAGDGAAEYLLGKMYLQGDGVAVDRDAARSFFIRAFPKIKERAEAGDAHCQLYLAEYYNKLGFFLRDEDSVNMPEGRKESLRWYTLAAEQGVAEAQFELGSIYWMSSPLAEMDADKAFFWFSKSAEQGWAEAQSRLGRCYENGDGTSVDEAQALAWFLKAAEQGNASGQYNAARCYNEGIGTEIDYAKAFYWYSKAADKISYALDGLGECYEKGRGVEKDLNKAVEAYTLAMQKFSSSFARSALKRVKRQLKQSSEK